MRLRLREQRLRQGLSQRDLSERTGITAANISRLETGETSQPRPSTLRKLAAGLGVEVAELWENGEGKLAA
jgi:HTH-type transcriptional regulator, competence development regulator